MLSKGLAEDEFGPIFAGLGVKTFQQLKAIRGLTVDSLAHLEEAVASKEQRLQLVEALARPQKKDELRK
eukprot:1677804-Prymnesium_polylepis.1